MLQNLLKGLLVLGCGMSGLTLAAPAADTNSAAPGKSPRHLLPGPDLAPTDRPEASLHTPGKGEWSFDRLTVTPMPKRPDMGIRIVGGTPVDAGKRTYQASLQSPAGHFCGGTVVGEQWVLTAGHCMDPYHIANGFSVLVGTHDLGGTGGVLIPATEVFVHPDFDGYRLMSDMALVRLAEPVPPGVEIVPLADEAIMRDFADTGADATATGWGAMGRDVIQSTVLQEATLPIADHAQCASIYSELYGDGAITGQMFCAGFLDGGVDTCQGDSGGPLTVDVNGQNYIIGITSWGNGCANPGYPGVYTRIASFADWLADIQQQPPVSLSRMDDTLRVEQLESAGDEYHYFSFQLPSAKTGLTITTEGDNGDADLYVYGGAYATSALIQCTSTRSDSNETCQIPLAPAGTYLIAIRGYLAFTGLDLQVDYQSNDITNGTVLENIRLRKNQAADVVLNISEPTADLQVVLSGGYGDADLYVTGRDDNDDVIFECESIDLTNEEQCTLAAVTPGRYVIAVVAYTDIGDVSLLVSHAADEPTPITTQANCEYRVLRQINRYTVAAVTVENTGTAPLEDWFVNWTYTDNTAVRTVINGIRRGNTPVHIEGTSRNSYLPPGAQTTVQLVVRTEDGEAEIPELSGNYCR